MRADWRSRLVTICDAIRTGGLSLRREVQRKPHIRIPSVEGAINPPRLATCPYDWCSEPHPHYHRGDPTRFAGKGG